MHLGGFLALRVVCRKIAFRLASGAKRTRSGRRRNDPDDPYETSGRRANDSGFLITH
jgi:hypothetical protein